MLHGLDLMQVTEDSGVDTLFSASAIFSGICPNKDVVRHYLNALSTLLYRQLRTIIENSVASVVKFMGRFKKSGPNSARKMAMPPFLIGLSVDTDSFKVSCKTTLGNIVDVLQETILQIPKNFYGWARLEHRALQELSHINGSKTSRCIWEVKDSENFIVDAILDIKAILEEAERPIHKLLESYSKFTFLSEEHAAVHKICEDRESEDLDLEMYRARLDTLQKAEASVRSSTSKSHNLTIVMVSCVELNVSLIKFIRMLKSKLLSNFENRSITLNYKIVESFKRISLDIAKKPSETSQLVEMECYLATAKDKTMSKLSSDVNKSRSHLLFLFEEGHRVALPLLHSIGSCVSWARRTPPMIEEAEKNLALVRGKMEGAFRLSHKNFVNDIEDLKDQAREFQSKGDIRHLSSFLEQLEMLQKDINTFFNKAHVFQNEERLLGWPVSEFAELTRIEESMKPFIKMWMSAKNFKESHREWLHGNVFDLDMDSIKQSVSTMISSMLHVVDKLETEFPSAASVASNVKLQLDQFKPFIPLIGAVANKGLRERHWEEVAHLVGFIVDPEESCSLQRLLDRGCGAHIPELEIIADSASKEWSIEQSLNSMEHEWKTTSFAVQSFMDSKTHILVENTVDEISSKIEDELVKVQGMKVSEYAPPHFQRILNLEEFLIQLQEIVAVWMKVQRLYVHLSPIFANDDIAQQMPDDARDFQLVDGDWRSMMASACQHLACHEIIQIKHLFRQLENSQMLLERLQKNLYKNLDTKCSHFPRLFFLARDDILKIISSSNDPVHIQQYLAKCFHGLHRFKFETSGAQKKIVALLSQQGEEIHLIVPISTQKAKGSAEILLRDVEKGMKSSMMNSISSAIADYPSKEWNHWVLAWPGQAVLVAAEYQWTAGIENVLREGAGDIGQSSILASQARVQESSTLLRSMSSTGNSKPAAMLTLSNLIMSELHHADVIAQLIAAKGVTEDAFIWQGQLRYYIARDEKVVTKVVHSTLHYQYEYLGNKARIALTPLSDRCYRAMYTAASEHFGGAIAGCTGSGKSETLLDVSSAVATYFVQFSCSNNVLPTAFTRMFQGMASTGSWACFDNLDRLQPSVLGVMSQQLQEIRQVMMSSGETILELGGHATPLKLESAIFATMRCTASSLCRAIPSSVRNHFRMFTFHTPPVPKIMEVLLCGHGYQDFRGVALKTVTFLQSIDNLKLSDRAPIQFGTKLLKDIVESANQNYSRDSKGIAQAIQSVVLPILDSSSKKTFRILLKEVFCWEAPDDPSSLELDKGSDALSAHGESLDLSEGFVTQLRVLEDVIRTHSYGILLVGDTLSGKTLSLDILRQYSPKSQALSENCIHITTINPRSLGFDELFGSMLGEHTEWDRGLFPEILRTSQQLIEDSTEDKYQWIVFDGLMNDLWLESVASILDSSHNHHYYQINGEVMHVGDRVTLFFECETLKALHPSFVSRCGISFLRKDHLTWQTAFKRWVEHHKAIVPSEGILKTITELFTWLVPAALSIQRSVNDSDFEQNDIALVSSVMSILGGLLSKFNGDGIDEYDMDSNATTTTVNGETELTATTPLQPFSKVNKKNEGESSRVATPAGQHPVEQEIESAFIFSLFWGLGSTLSDKARLAFDQKLKQIATGRNPKYPPPRQVAYFKGVPFTASCLFDFVFVPSWLVASVSINTEDHVSKHGWKKWDIDRMLAEVPAEPAHISQVLIPTADFVLAQYFMRLSTLAKYNILFMGDSGSGKSRLVEHYLQNGAPGDSGRLQVLHQPCSAYTTSSDLLDMIEDKFEKRRRGVYGPSLNKVGVLFIDDVHLPSLDTQSPVELLRNIADHGGWFDKVDYTFQKFEEQHTIATMCRQQ